MVRRRYSADTRAISAPSARLRPKSFRVVRPWSTSRKWALMRPSAWKCFWLMLSAPMPTRTVKNGIRGAVRSSSAPAAQLTGKTAAAIVSGTSSASASWGR